MSIMFRQASRLLGRPCWPRPRPFSTEVPAATPSTDSSFAEAWKKVMPNTDAPRTPSTYMEPRPPTPSSLPSKMAVNFVLPYSSELSAKQTFLSPFSCCFNTIGQYYWISLGAFLSVLLILPLSLLSPFLAGLSALFSKENRRASLARVYAMWNATSLTNIVVAFICGIFHYGFSSSQPPDLSNAWNTRREDDKWWLLPTVLLLFKLIQARFVDWHMSNVEIQDYSLFCPDSDAFWALEAGI